MANNSNGAQPPRLAPEGNLVRIKTAGGCVTSVSPLVAQKHFERGEATPLSDPPQMQQGSSSKSRSQQS